MLHAILDRQVDGLELVLDNIEARIEILEDAVFARPRNAQIASLLSVLTYVYFYFHPVPALAGTFVAAIALAAIWRETLVSGAHWPFGRKTTGNLTASQSQGSRSTGLRGRM